jgi:hypothetical protein
MPNTFPANLPYPNSFDPVANGAQNIQDLAEAVNDGGGLWLVKTQAIGTGVSSVSVTDAFSASFQNYRIVITGVSFTVGDTNFNIRPNGVSSASYFGGGFFQQFGSSTLNPFIQNAAAQSAIGITAGVKNAHIFDVTDPFDSSSWTRFLSLPNTGGAYVAHYWGLLATNASYTNFTMFPSSGTMTGGTIRVYGYRN